jgi:putative ABC transport system ATP-binding protein
LSARHLFPTHDSLNSALAHTAREAGTAVLLITHDTRTAAYADREVSLLDGVVVEEDPAPAVTP